MLSEKGAIMLEEFKNPSNSYRPIPFWSWNDQLEKEELEYQIEEMKKACVGGYFMHARSGLKVEYLSQQWFDCIKTGIEKGREVGLDVWAYDEEGWPSGFAGGIVPALSQDYHAKYMTMQTHSSTQTINRDEILAGYIFDIEHNRFKPMDLSLEYVCKQNEKLLAVKRHTNPFYIDTMNKRAVEAFLKVTHEAYYEKFGDDFGKYMKGFFTDEPRYINDHFGELPWSDDLSAEFIKTYGYDIRAFIPALYLETENYERYRYDFWSLVNALFVRSYMKTIYDWCEAHKVQVTGHIMMEESIFSQMTSTAGVMPFYEYLHIPGIDWLRRSISSPIIAKQVGSVACQLGKKNVLTESFALCGWDVSFEELKWIAEWQFVNGVNQICQHLQAYTIKGIRKRDYPPSLFIQQTWWKEYRKFNDYLGRVCVVLSQGNQTADVLLLHPMRSGYVTYNGTRTDEIRLLDEKFTELAQVLSGNHISYHLGDETIIDKYASVEAGQFVVGEVRYKTVIMPDMYALAASTLKLLLEFSNKGGTILSVGRFPSFTNGCKEDLALLEERVLKTQHQKVRAVMKQASLVSLSITQHNQEIQSISYQQRETAEGSLLFIVNHNQKEKYCANVTVFGKCCTVKRLVAESGDCEEMSFTTKEGDTHFTLNFEPMQSYIILLEKAQEYQCYEVKQLPEQTVTLRQQWTIDKMQLNSMTLDCCHYRVDGGELLGPVAVIQLQERLLSLQRPCEVELIYHFEVDMTLSENKEFYVVVEDPELFVVQVNGQRLEYKDIGYWKDKSFKKMDIKAAVVNGSNEIVLKTVFKQPQKVYDVLFGENVYETEKNKITYDMELESIYLLGDFGVVSRTPYRYVERNAVVTRGDFLIVDAPKQFSTNQFTTAGLAFFAGELVVSQSIEIHKQAGKKIVLDLKKQRAPLVKVYVNDQWVKDSLWAPYQIDITPYVIQGTNKISLQLFASNRNLLGPHHHIDGECYNVGPDSFTGRWSWVERKSEADATEISDRTKNYWMDAYCLVEFGL